jgi:hypothetical protein
MAQLAKSFFYHLPRKKSRYNLHSLQKLFVGKMISEPGRDGTQSNWVNERDYSDQKMKI